MQQRSLCQCHICVQGDRNIICAPQSQKKYCKNLNAVHKNEQENADWLTPIHTTQYYSHILCWGLDHVILTCYMIVWECANAGIGPPEWKKYLSKQDVCHSFQIHLAIALSNHAMALDWNDTGERPGWIRQKGFVPFNCKRCYFCINRHMCGFYHPQEKKRVVEYKHGNHLRMRGCTKMHVATILTIVGNVIGTCQMMMRMVMY